MSEIFLDPVHTGSFLKAKMIRFVKLKLKSVRKIRIFLQLVVCAFVELFYMCWSCLVFVCGLEDTFVCTQNHAQIVAYICKSYFSLVDHVICICDHFESNFSTYIKVQMLMHQSVCVPVSTLSGLVSSTHLGGCQLSPRTLTAAGVLLLSLVHIIFKTPSTVQLFRKKCLG